MSGPRNPKAVALKLAQREQIKSYLLEYARRYPLCRLTGKQIQAQFPHLALSTVQGYIADIREEAEAEANSPEIL